MLLCAEHIIPVVGDPISNGAVLVRDGLIQEIGGAQRMKTHYADEEVYDFGSAAIIPGFVDCHTHLEYSALRGVVHDVPYAEWLMHEHAKANLMSYDDRYDSALLGGMEMLAGGVTTVADFTSSGASREAVQDVGLRSVIYRSVGAPEKANVDVAVADAVADIQEWQAQADGRMRIGIAPKALHACHPTIFAKVNAVAADMNLPVAMHVAGSYEEYRYIKEGATPLSVRGITSADADSLTDRPTWLPTGVTPVNYALNWDAFHADNVMAVHCVHVDDEDIAKLREYDVAVAICTRCNAQLGMGLAPLQKLLNAGLRVGLGTDSPAATDSADMFTEMRLGMLIHRAVNRRSFLSAQTMLELATIGSARVLRMEDEIGSIEVGKRADLVAVDLSASRQTPLVNPVTALVSGSTATDVMFTMVDGEVLYERGGALHIAVDPEEVVHRAVQLRTRLRN